MQVRVLGPLEIVGDDGERCDPAATRQRRVLLALLVWRGQPVSVDRIIDVLWSDGALPRDPVATVRTYVSRIRTALEPDHVGGRPQILTGGPERYVLDLAEHEVDAEAFEADLKTATALLEDDPTQALACLDRALSRWRGPALAEVADEVWARAEAERIEGLRVTAEEHRLRCMLDSGWVDEAVIGLQQQTQLHPLRERPHGLLMLALDRAGRAAEASEVFHTFRARLGDELGLDPSADLEQLHSRLLHSSSASTFAALAPGRWDRIPVPRTPLVGRDPDIATVWELLVTRQVVTIVGAGGVGKTRLAAELTYRSREAGGDVVFAELADVDGAEGIVDAVFDGLQLPAVGRRNGLEGLLRLLRPRPVRLVLDNCEHLVEAVAEVVAALIRELPQLTVLATSREPLGIEGERVFRLASLDLDSAGRLFRERAVAAGAIGSFTSADDPRIRNLCSRLDGIPLAIQFAASAAAHLGLQEVAERLEDRIWSFAGGRDALPRHETLEAAIAWSYDLLTEPEKDVLHAAASFVHGFDVAGLADVAARSEDDTLEVLTGLVRKSLVDTEHAGEPPRLRLLETIRGFALRRVHETGALEDLRLRHAQHFLGRALRFAPCIDDLPPAVDRSMCRLRLRPPTPGPSPDTANHVAALAWLNRAGRLADVGRLAARMSTVLGQAGFLDPEHRYLARDDVAAALTEDPAELALYQMASALNACYVGSFPHALRWGQAAMATAPDPGTRSAAGALAVLASTGLDPDRVSDLAARALEDAPPDARFTRLVIHGQRSLSLVMQGRLREAAEQLESHVRLGDAFAAAEQLVVLHVLGDDDRALQITVPEKAYPDGAALWRYRWPLARALAHAARGEAESAKTALLEAGQHVATSPLDHEHDILVGCAALAYHTGDAPRALQLLEAVGRRVISPASFVLCRHYRRLVEDAICVDQHASSRELAGTLDPRQLLRDELSALS